MLDAFDVIKNKIEQSSEEEKAETLARYECAFKHLGFAELLLFLAYALSMLNLYAHKIRTMNSLVNGASSETNWSSSCDGIRNGYNNKEFNREWGLEPPVDKDNKNDGQAAMANEEKAEAEVEAEPEEESKEECDGRECDLDEEDDNDDDDDDSAEENNGKPTEPKAGSLQTQPSTNTSRGLRQKSGNKPGRQKGDKGGGFHITGDVEENTPQYYVPEKCKDCPFLTQCLKNAKANATRHVYDIKVVSYRDTFISVDIECPQTGKVLSGELPKEIKDHTKYGDNIKAFAMTLRDIGLVSYSRIAEILQAATSFSIGTGTLNSISREYYTKLSDSGAIDLIKDETIASGYVSADETGADCSETESKLWAHTLVTATTVLIAVSMSRGYAGMVGIGVIPLLSCVLQHDFWLSYFKFGNVTHAMCGAHLLRELLKMQRFYPEVFMPAYGLFNLLNRMLEARREAMDAGRSRIDPELFGEFWEEYDAWVEMGLMLSPDVPEVPGKKKKGKKKESCPKNLFKRFRDYKDEILLFMVDFSINFTNNRAEKSFRLLKTAIKVFGTFRTKTGAEEFVARFSYLQTCRLRKINRFDAIKRAFKGEAKQVLLEFEKKEQA